MYCFIVWEMLTRKMPYAGANPIHIMQNVAHRGGRPAALTEEERLASHPSLVDLYETCLAEDPAERPSFQEMLYRLQ